ncbi:hypothetical protein Tco_1378746 [Tanacetum coccineum]
MATKVTSIEESKNLTTLPFDELIGNLKVYEEEEVMKIAQAPIVKDGRVCLWAVKEFKNSSERGRFVENHEPPKNNDQRAFIGGAWSDNGEDEMEKTKDETCLVAQAPMESCFRNKSWNPMGGHKDSGWLKTQTSAGGGGAVGALLYMRCPITPSLKRFLEQTALASPQPRSGNRAIDLSKNPVQHSRTKHIEIRHHFLRDNVQKGNISIEKVSSEDNIADILTKPLKREPFNYLRLDPVRSHQPRPSTEVSDDILTKDMKEQDPKSQADLHIHEG